jgi:hypothetical protein
MILLMHIPFPKRLLSRPRKAVQLVEELSPRIELLDEWTAELHRDAKQGSAGASEEERQAIQERTRAT